MSLVLALGFALSWPPSSAQGQNQPPAYRVASIGVCADQLLLEFANPDQILLLSADAADARISFHAARAEAFPRGGGLEAVVSAGPDLVFADAGLSMDLAERLERLGFRVVVLDTATTIDMSIAQIREVAELVGRPDRGEILVNLVEAARRQAFRANRGVTVVGFHGDGRIASSDSLTGDLLTLIGMINIGDSLARADRSVPLEVLVAQPPDYLLVPDSRQNGAGSLGMLTHPVAMELFPPARRLELADRLTHCGGPSLPDAIGRLGIEIGGLTP